MEITEISLMGDKHATVARLRALRALGVRIAVDDFGTGYPSLSYLHHFPIDILKIDRSFVTAATEGPEEAALAQAVVKLASVLQLKTVAEGIETPEQLEKLRDLGCQAGQGYLFSRPVESVEIEDRLWARPLAPAVPAAQSA
jgi:EAL domain-containing protein (putative c-di-GMP-specific phosphodiesterase class I)